MSARIAWLTAAIALGVPGAAAAAWSVVAATKDYFVEFDPALVRQQGAYAMAWTRMTFTIPQRHQDSSNDTRYQSQLQLHAVDCTTSASTVVGVVMYASALGNGAVVARSTRPRTQWTPKPAPPDTLSDVTVRLACAEIARRAAQ